MTHRKKLVFQNSFLAVNLTAMLAMSWRRIILEIINQFAAF